MSLAVEIVTPSEIVFSGSVDQIQAPGVFGEFGILPQHASMLAVTQAGCVTLHSQDGERVLVVGPGFAEVGPDQVTLLVDLCEEVGTVDKATAQADLTAGYAELGKVDAFSDEGVLLQKRIDLAQARLTH